MRLRQAPLTTLFPSTTLFRSGQDGDGRLRGRHRADVEAERTGDAVDLGLGDARVQESAAARVLRLAAPERADIGDRKSTRLNSSHLVTSYAVFCLKTK